MLKMEDSRYKVLFFVDSKALIRKVEFRDGEIHQNMNYTRQFWKLYRCNSDLCWPTILGSMNKVTFLHGLLLPIRKF